MNNNLITAVAVSILLFIHTGCSKNEYGNNPQQPVATIVSTSGDITTGINQFRTLLGDSLNTTPGKLSGRREINWDGVALSFTNNNNFPADFFNSTDPAVTNGRKRGLVYINNGATFRVDSSLFSEINATYATQFKAFSPKKTFSVAGSNIAEVVFKVAGTNTEAFVHGFGVIFSDVDDALSSSLEFFAGSKSLGVFKAPISTNGSFSFLGVYFLDEKVTRVKITTGNAALAPGVNDISNGGAKDIVVIDDLFYDEPKENKN